MRLAATFGHTWVTVDSGGAGSEQVAQLDEACSAVGREPSSLRRLVLVGFRERPLDSIQAFRDAVGCYGEMGFTDLVVHWPRPGEPFAGDPKVLEKLSPELTVEA